MTDPQIWSLIAVSAITAAGFTVTGIAAILESPAWERRRRRRNARR